MRGAIAEIDTTAGSGFIAGADGQKYPFAVANWRGKPAALAPGVQVDFVAVDGHARDVYDVPVIPAAVPPQPAPPYPGQPDSSQAAPGQPYPGQPYPGQPVAYPQYEKSNVVAGLLALFLGAWGVHKFYLGYTQEGGIMLGATLLSIVLCIVIIGIFGLMAIGTIAFVEGIIYLTKSPPEFQHIYVQGRRPWF